MPNNNLKVLDLFCGCGGLSEGLSQAGFNIVAGIDFWKRACESLQKNHVGGNS